MEQNKMKIAYVITQRKDRNFWNRVGVAFVNSDGSINVKLEAVPVSGEIFTRYGVSTTPTLVFINRDGTVKLYHPGQMTKAEARLKAAFDLPSMLAAQAYAKRAWPDFLIARGRADEANTAANVLIAHGVIHVTRN